MLFRKKEKQSRLCHIGPGALWSYIWPYTTVLRLGAYTVGTVRTLAAKKKHLSAPLLPL